MDKRGVALTLETILGLIFGALIVVGLFSGINKIVNVFLLPEQGSEFIEFKEKIDNLFLIETKEEEITLSLRYNELVFSTEKSVFPTDIILKNPVTNKENKFNSISKPLKCQEKVCICKCLISDLDIQGTKLKCMEENLDCFNIKEVEKVEGEIIVNFVAEEGDSIGSSDLENNFLIYSTKLDPNQKRSSVDSYNFPLLIEKQEKGVKITLSS
jgi:hypothetical protein